MYPLVIAAIVIVAIAVAWFWSSVLILREYERAVVFRLGRVTPDSPWGPGLVLLIPLVDRAEKVDLRTITLNVPPQEVITKDNVPVRVNAVAYFSVVDPVAAITRVQRFREATSQIAQTTLRSTLGQHVLDELLAERDSINAILQKIVDEQTAPWGVKVSVIEIRDVEIPNAMQRAMARQAEAERERRAKVISAQGEFEASAKLSEAAEVLAAQPISVQLRYLQTLIEMSSERTSTIVVPIPVELLTHFGAPSALTGDGGGNGRPPA
jgi:regulator of protease activity HflC (stomatin/prohibitin superfamily)